MWVLWGCCGDAVGMLWVCCGCCGCCVAAVAAMHAVAVVAAVAGAKSQGSGARGQWLWRVAAAGG